MSDRIALEVPALPDGYGYRVKQAKAAYIEAAVIKFNTATGTAALYPHAEVDQIRVNGMEVPSWRAYTPAERVQYALKIMGNRFVERWQAEQETNEMRAYVGEYDATGVKRP